MTTQNFSSDDLTKPLVEADTKYGKFESDPNDQFVQRYIPNKDELANIEAWLAEEIDQAIGDDHASRQRKLDLLRAYHGMPEGQEQILVIPLIKRAVNQNVSWVVNTVMSKRPLCTVTPDSNDQIQVLVPTQQGPMPLTKTSEEVAADIETWLQYKLLKRLPFRKIVKTAAFEAKRGQTPTWLKITYNKEYRKTTAPRFEKSGPIAVTFQSKEEIDVLVDEPTQIQNISTYSMLLPADEQDPQAARWLAESTPLTNEDLRRCFYNGDYFLIPEDEWDNFIRDGASAEMTEADQQKAALERRIAAAPKSGHDVREVWFKWVVPMKSTLVSIDTETGEQTQKSRTVNQEFSFVGHFHRKLGRLMDMVRNPFDHGERPYIPVFDRKEPFRLSGGSTAEDVWPYQNVVSQLNSLEIRGGVIATTPVTFADPGSTAGEWVASNAVEPGSVIPRLRPDEIEVRALAERPQSLLGLIQFHNGEYEKQTSIGDLQLGLDVKTHTTANAVAQVINAGETQAADFLDDFRECLGDALKMYVQTVQQYMRFGEIIPFDPETKATILAALQGGAGTDQYGGVTPEDLNAGMPVRFPMEPIQRQFAFNITASSDDRSQQGDFEKLVAAKKLIDADSQKVAQMIGPIASGNMPDNVVQILLADFTRGEKMMELIMKSLRKDGRDFSISPRLVATVAREQAQLAQQRAQNPPPPPPPQTKININLAGQLGPNDVMSAEQVAGIGGASGPQGVAAQPGGGVPQVPNNAGGLAAPVQQRGVSHMPVAHQGGNPPPPVVPFGRPR